MSENRIRCDECFRKAPSEEKSCCHGMLPFTCCDCGKEVKAPRGWNPGTDEPGHCIGPATGSEIP